MIRNVLSIAMFAAVFFALGCGGGQGDSESAGESAASQQEASAHKPTLIYLDADNRIKDARNAIPVQVA